MKSILERESGSNFHVRRDGTTAVTIRNVDDLDALPFHHVMQLSAITEYLRPRSALKENPQEIPICSLL